MLSTCEDSERNREGCEHGDMSFEAEAAGLAAPAGCGILEPFSTTFCSHRRPFHGAEGAADTLV